MTVTEVSVIEIPTLSRRALALFGLVLAVAACALLRRSRRLPGSATATDLR